jgi:hypothetical protein
MTPSIDNLYAALNADKSLRGAAFYIDQKTVMKLTRQFRGGRFKSETFLFTIGAPNFAERRKLATMKKNNTGMPVYEERPWPVKRAATKRTASMAVRKAVKK